MKNDRHRSASILGIKIKIKSLAYLRGLGRKSGGDGGWGDTFHIQHPTPPSYLASLRHTNLLSISRYTEKKNNLSESHSKG